MLKAALADRVPPVLRGGRVDPALRGALALTAVALLAALVAAYFAWRSRPEAVVARPVATTSPAPAPAPSPGGPTGSAMLAGTNPSARPSSVDVVVDVAGKVRRPGVVHLPAGARVIDALASAGGVLPGVDTTGLALARRVLDGEQILVTGQAGPAAGVAADAGSTASGGAASGLAPGGGDTGAPVNLNQATESQLDALPGVGPVLAQRIVDWRQQHGSFTSTQQLGDVEGVGDKKLADLLPLVTV